MRSFTALLTCVLLAVEPFADATCTKGILPAREAKAVSSFRKNKIIPGVVAPSWDPKLEVIPNYGSKIINFGTVTSTLETVQEPTIRFNAEPGFDARKTNYTGMFASALNVE